MYEITASSTQLPAKPEDLAKFILVGREKLTSVRAEIRAIDKLNLAQDVRNQKREEARMLAEALLDAEVRLGDLLKQIPKATAAKGNQHSGKWNFGTDADNPKPKQEVIRELGFSPDQAQRFETLASHPDLVEQVKADARENDDLPTRTAVLNLAKYRQEKAETDYQQIDQDAKLAQALVKAVAAVEQLPTDLISVTAMMRGSAVIDRSDMATSLKTARDTLSAILRHFEKRGG